MNYREILKSKLNQLKSESRYRTFIELERQTGWHPHALWNSPDGPKDVVVWCLPEYLWCLRCADLSKRRGAIANSRGFVNEILMHETRKSRRIH